MFRLKMRHHYRGRQLLGLFACGAALTTSVAARADFSAGDIIVQTSSTLDHYSSGGGSFGSFGDQAFLGLHGLAYSDAGNGFFATLYNGTIFNFNQPGVELIATTGGGISFSVASHIDTNGGIAALPGGVIAITDSDASHRVVALFSTDSTFLQAVTLSAAASALGPSTVDSDGSLLVAAGNQIFDISKSVGNVYSSTLLRTLTYAPALMAGASDGTLWVTDSSNNLHHLSAGGADLLLPISVSNPVGMAAANDGSVYISSANSSFLTHVQTNGSLALPFFMAITTTPGSLVVFPGGGPVTGEWQNPLSGDWQDSSNWIGGVPNSIDSTANFFSTANPVMVTIRSAETVGHITFNNTFSYKVSNDVSGSLTLRTSAGSADVTVLAGQHTFVNVPVILQSDTTFNIAGAGSSLTMQGGSVSGNPALTKTGPGTLELGDITGLFGDITVNQGTLVVNSQLSDNSVLHLNAGASGGGRVIFRGESGNFDQYQQNLNQAYQSGLWNQAPFSSIGDITTDTPFDTNSNMILGVGFLTAGQYKVLHGLGSGLVFDPGFNAMVDDDDLLLRLTYMGDADLDGRITIDDYLQIDAGSHRTSFPLGYPTWFDGDFNFDKVIDYKDYALIDASYAMQSGTLASGMISMHAAEFGSLYMNALIQADPGIPEPASLAMLAMAALPLLRRRRRI